MELESYKVQFRIYKKDLTKSKDSALQIESVKNQIKKGTAELSLLERTDDYFEYPDGAGNYPDWNNKMNIDHLIEFELLLAPAQENDIQYIRELACSYIERFNAFDYIYEDADGRHISFCTIDVPETSSMLSDKEWEKQQKKEEKEKKKLTDLFSKKGKSK